MRLPETIQTLKQWFTIRPYFDFEKNANDWSAAVLQWCKSRRFSREHLEVDNESFTELALLDIVS